MSPSPRFSAVDLFSGCGGLSLGFSMAGFRIVKAFDMWPCAVNTYNANFDHPAELCDLSDMEAWRSRLGDMSFNAIIGGPPCQDFSSAGNRQEREKAGMTCVFARAVNICRPELFVMENVSRARTSNAYANARAVFKAAGYGLTEAVLNADRCGVPQTRKRFFCIGAQNKPDGWLDAQLNERLSETPLTVRQYLQDELTVNHYYRHPRNYNRRGVFSIDEPSATIRGVSRPLPEGYKGHPKDSAPLTQAIRPLTTLERSRIQTFPQDFRWLGSKSEIEQMIGNAVPVNLARFVASAILAML